jgi:malate synthase
MLEIHSGIRTQAGARENIRVAIQYIAAWLGGRGAVPLYNLMEDAATAEICRAQLWQWLHFEARLDDGRRFCRDLFEECLRDELGKLGRLPHVQPAARLFYDLVTADKFEEFLTLPAYPLLD